MRIKQIKVYPFDELSDEAREKAIEKLSDINLFDDWYQVTYEDAEQVGLKLTGFDIGRGNYCKGEFIESAKDTAERIIHNHGQDCETYKTAIEFNEDSAKLYMKYPVEMDKDGFDNNEEERDEEQEETDAEFLKAILEDYRIILQKEYEHLASETTIIETIKANEYEFTADGELA